MIGCSSSNLFHILEEMGVLKLKLTSGAMCWRRLCKWVNFEILPKIVENELRSGQYMDGKTWMSSFSSILRIIIWSSVEEDIVVKVINGQCRGSGVPPRHFGVTSSSTLHPTMPRQREWRGATPFWHAHPPLHAINSSPNSSLSCLPRELHPSSINTSLPLPYHVPITWPF